MAPGLRAAALLSMTLLPSCAPTYVVHGTVVEEETQAPIPRATVRVLDSDIDIRTDSLGRFVLKGRSQSRCVVVQVLALDFGPTFRTLPLPRPSSAGVTIPLRAGWIPESRGLLLQECIPGDTVRVH